MMLPVAPSRQQQQSPFPLPETSASLSPSSLQRFLSPSGMSLRSTYCVCDTDGGDDSLTLLNETRQDGIADLPCRSLSPPLLYYSNSTLLQLHHSYHHRCTSKKKLASRLNYIFFESFSYSPNIVILVCPAFISNVCLIANCKRNIPSKIF